MVEMRRNEKYIRKEGFTKKGIKRSVKKKQEKH